MTRVTPQEGTTKWVNRLSAAVPDVQAGIAKVTEAPGAKAAQKFTKWQQNTQAAAQKWKNNTAAVGLSQWQQAATAGTSRIASGAQQKQGKYEQFASSFYPYLDSGVAKVKNMPDTNFEDRIQRAVAMMRYNANYKRPAGG
jgi:hypothetical protein